MLSNLVAIALLGVIFFTAPLISRRNEVAVVNWSVPEGPSATSGALNYFIVSVLLGRLFAWLVFVFLTHPVRGTVWAYLGWISSAWVVFHFDLHPIIAYGFHLLLTTWIHPVIRHWRYGIEFSQIVIKQQQGCRYFVSTSAAIFVLGRIFNSHLSPLVLCALRYSGLAYVAWKITSDVVRHELAERSYANRKTKLSREPASGANFRHAAIIEPSQFRLLLVRRSIFPGRSLDCQLEDFALEQCPSYTAISYRCDQTSPMVKISINGQDFAISSKVRSILHSKRSWFRSQHLWIDCICISQSDGKEKALQIGFMSSIFGNAEQVVGFLDLSTTEQASKALKYLGSSYLSGNLHDRSDEAERAVREHGLEQTDYEDDFLQTISDSYFERVWIVQEVALAKKYFLRVGKLEVPWEVVSRSMSIIARAGLLWSRLRFGSSSSDGVLRVRKASAILNTIVMASLHEWYESNQLLALSDMFKIGLMFESTRPEDKVFGLLSLIKQDGLPPVDYDNPCVVENTYKAAARLMMRERDPFHILRFAGIGQKRNPISLPTWCPDWTMKLQTCILGHSNPEYDYRASGDTDPLAIITDNHVEILGKEVDRIRKVFALPQYEILDGMTSDDILAQIKSPNFLSISIIYDLLRPYLDSPDSYSPTNQHPVEAYIRTLSGDMTPQHRPLSQRDQQRLFYTRFALEHLVITRAQSRPSFISPKLGIDESDSAYPRHEFSFLTSKVLSHSSDVKFAHLLSCSIPASTRSTRTGFVSILDDSALPSWKKEEIDFTIGRKIAVTDHGYLALVPEYTEEDDIVAILYGAKTPFVLRERDRLPGKDMARVKVWDDADVYFNVERRTVELVGEMYGHGMMDGEMLDSDKKKNKFDSRGFESGKENKDVLWRIK